MPEQPRFLLGYGERLAGPVQLPPRGSDKELPYTFTEALDRLTPQIDSVSNELFRLPRAACPNDQAVGIITMHPGWTAKSYFPRHLLESFNLRSVGSRPASITGGEGASSHTTEIYVAGRRDDFRVWAERVRRINPAESAATDLRRIELIRVPDSTDRVRVPPSGRRGKRPFEAVLHTGGMPTLEYVLDAFEAYALGMDVEPDTDRALQVGGLCFLPIYAKGTDLQTLSRFAFLRTVRPIPRLRIVHPIERALGNIANEPTPAPDTEAIDPTVIAAVLDGGLLDSSTVDRWTTAHEGDNIGQGQSDFERHGTQVTSAVLFGPLVPGEAAPRPYGVVDNYRVLDTASGHDFDLYDVLKRIDTVLSKGTYEFVNLSLGPDLTVEDDEVHPWTALLDHHLSTGNVLATVAVGNGGTADHASGNSRIQVPGDAVNALGVGAADSMRQGWNRAPYSSIGPGRRPGVVKPDVLAFGGTKREPFFAYTDKGEYVVDTMGTSFASPSTLRLAMGVRAHFGKQLGTLALKTLLIHTAERHDSGPAHTGWGRCSNDIASLVVCNDGMVRVVYQGVLSPAQVLRVPVPLPADDLPGKTKISATICYATPVDPQDPGNYTRAGLVVTFRPHADRFGNNLTLPKSDTFFRNSDYETEQEQRKGSHKWETVLDQFRTFNSGSLKRPLFDIHYVAREGGGYAANADPVRYAMVITVENLRTSDLYEQVVRQYATILQPIQQRIDIPIEIS